jgi:hypothetical protein
MVRIEAQRIDNKAALMPGVIVKNGQGNLMEPHDIVEMRSQISPGQERIDRWC